MTAKAKVKLSKKGKDGIRRIEELAKELRKPGQVVVGLPAGSNDYPNVKSTSILMVGAVHEFGSIKRNIPQRSFLRSTMVANKRKYKRLLTKLSKRIVSGKDTSEKAMQLLGQQVEDDVKLKILKGPFEPLEPATVAAKGKTGPLRNTGHLRDSIRWQIIE